jgi:polysaccharide export outer membrane protein
MRLKIYLSFRSFISLFFSIAILLLSSTAHAQTTTTPQQPTAPTPLVINTGNLSEDDSYRIGPGDVLDVRVYGRPELGRETRVDNRGNVRLPFIGDVKVACLNENRLAQVVTEKFKKYLRDPQVDVFVKEYKSQPVAVIGMVGQPGRFQLQRRVRLLELLTFSGGPSLNSGGVVHIIRGTAPDFCEKEDADQAASPAAIVTVASPPPGIQSASGQTATNTAPADLPDQKTIQASVDQGQAVLLSYKLKEVLVGDPQNNPYVRPGDIISVPETDQVFVIGNVVKPGPIPMRNKITLLQAIGMAGGFMPDAAKGKVRVVRIEPGSNIRKEFVYDINEIQRKKAEDITLMPSDVVDVPTSVTKNTARSLLAVGIGVVGYLPYLIIR